MAQTPYTVADLVKNNPNYQASWDPATKTSSLLDTLTGKKMSWSHGASNSNGVTGQLYNNSNVIDPNKISNYFKNNSNSYSSLNNNSQSINDNNIDWDSLLKKYSPAPVVDNTERIKSQYGADLANQISLLRQAVANSKAKLEAQKPQIQQQANDLRSQVYTNARVSAIGNNERLANEGLAGALYAGPQSGVSESSRIKQDTAMGNDINSVSRQEQEQLNDVTNAILEQDRQENYGVQTLSAQNASSLAQSLINESNRVYEQTNQNNQTSLSNIIAALGAKNDLTNSEFNRAIQEADLTGSYKGVPTMQKQQMDTQNRQWQQDYDSKVQQQKLDNLYRQQTFDYQKSRDAADDTRWQKQFNLDMRKQSQAEAQQKIDNAYRSRQISLEERNEANRWIQYNAEKDQQSLDNKNRIYQNAIDNINNLYAYKDSVSGETRINPSSMDSIRKYILSLNLDDDMTDQLLSFYKLPTN